jgi:hypothetical protein
MPTRQGDTATMRQQASVPVSIRLYGVGVTTHVASGATMRYRRAAQHFAVAVHAAIRRNHHERNRGGRTPSASVSGESVKHLETLMLSKTTVIQSCINSRALTSTNTSDVAE